MPDTLRTSPAGASARVRGGSGRRSPRRYARARGGQLGSVAKRIGGATAQVTGRDSNDVNNGGGDSSVAEGEQRGGVQSTLACFFTRDIGVPSGGSSRGVRSVQPEGGKEAVKEAIKEARRLSLATTTEARRRQLI
jgi:hypothetical protein